MKQRCFVDGASPGIDKFASQHIEFLLQFGPLINIFFVKTIEKYVA
jgi:hypothetical protein